MQTLICTQSAFFYINNMAAATIKNFEILNNGTQLAIEVETIVGSMITSIKLWSVDTFKNETLSIDLNYKLEQTTNIESFILTVDEINISSFIDIWFIEVGTNYTGTEGCVNCQDPALGITYNLQTYYKCMLNYLLNTNKFSDCNLTNSQASNLTIMVNLLINTIEKSLSIGFYSQAIEMLTKLKKLCAISKCKNCETVICSSCSKFIQQ